MPRLAMAVLVFVALLAAPAHAAMWTVIPPGPWGCYAKSNDCVGHTGFKPAETSWWGAHTDPVGNCTNYVAYRLVKNGAPEPRVRPGHARDWAAWAKALGKRVDSKPAVGAIAWWNAPRGGGLGHVAYVERLMSGGKIQISESMAGEGSARETLEPGKGGWPQRFLHIFDKPEGSSPVGRFERAEVLADGRVRVSGWAFDPDGAKLTTRVEAWVGGFRGKPGARRVLRTVASRSRELVAREHPKAGPDHGFKATTSALSPGPQIVRVYVIDRVGGNDPAYLGGKTVRIPGTPAGAPPASDEELGEPGAPELDPDTGGEPVEQPIATPGPGAPSFVLSNGLGGLPAATFAFGQAGDIPLAGDWDGDGVDTPGVFRPSNGQWLLANTLGGPPTIVFSYGRAGYLPVVGDWNGDGKDTQGVFRPSDAMWILSNALATAGTIYFKYGRSTDVPVAGDFNGDGKDTHGVFRPAAGTWILSNTLEGAGTVTFSFGLASDIPIVGDWNGDRVDSQGVFRPTGAAWFLAHALGSAATSDATFGAPSDAPIAGDWDGDRADSPGVFRP